MGKGKGKSQSSKKRKRSRAKAGRAGNAKLAKREQPTDRGYFHGSDRFNKRLEEMQETVNLEETVIEIIFAKLAEVRARLYASSRSPAPLCITGFLGNLVLHVTRAPEWAQLGVVVLPAAIALSSKVLERRNVAPNRRSQLKQSRTTKPVSDNT